MCVFLPPSRTLTELMKQPGEAGVVDGTGVHHPIGTNGISARSLRSNNGQSTMCVCVCVCLSICVGLHVSTLSWCKMTSSRGFAVASQINYSLCNHRGPVETMRCTLHCTVLYTLCSFMFAWQFRSVKLWDVSYRSGSQPFLSACHQ